MENEITKLFVDAIQIDQLDDEQIKTLEEIFKDYK